MSKEYADFLLDELAVRKRRNPSYSLRSFAKSLRVSPAHLSQVINGKKKPSPKLLAQFVAHLTLTPHQAQRFILSGLPQLARIPEEVRSLTDDEFSHLAEWHNFAILSYAALKDPQADASKIAGRLRIDLALVKDSLRRLQRLGLLKVEKGRLKLTSRPLMVGGADVPSTFIRNFHKQILELAQQRLTEVAVDKREFSASTLAINSRKIPLAKKMIKEFRERLLAELESDDASDVYVLSLHLFPCTLNDNETEEEF